MTRENIEYEAKNYSYRNYTSNLVDVSSESFIAGAKWANKHPDVSSLWHDVSEEPKEDMDILCIFKEKNTYMIPKIKSSLYNLLKDNNDVKKMGIH